ncbi:MAG: hypothetical protein JAZ06_00820 [Candidatus Thiodiazotropha taylori]|nr:hypothetical protein [Candidatus Thiodiazotropha taylori]
MSIRLKNTVWIGFTALIYYFYYTAVAGYWLDKEEIDPLVVNFIYVPALFGLVTIAGLRETLIDKALWLVFMPVIPCLILGQEGDPAKPGLQWMLIVGMQLPYWFSGAVVGNVMAYEKQRTAPNKRV